MRILRKPEVLRLTGLSASTIARLEERGQFPRRIQLGSSAVGWREDELLDWIASLRRREPATIEGAASPESSAAGREPLTSVAKTER